jgi:hypothetical protein
MAMDESHGFGIFVQWADSCLTFPNRHAAYHLYIVSAYPMGFTLTVECFMGFLNKSKHNLLRSTPYIPLRVNSQGAFSDTLLS